MARGLGTAGGQSSGDWVSQAAHFHAHGEPTDWVPRVLAPPRAEDYPSYDLPRPHRVTFGLAPAVIASLAVVLVGFGVAVLATAPSADTPIETARLEAPPPQWIEIVRPIEIFSLEAPDLAKDARFYQARRHTPGGGRQDTLGFGKLNGQDAFLRLTVYRPGAEKLPQAHFYVALARNAAAAGLSIGRSLQPQEDMTRFGRFEVADLDLVGQDGSIAPCLGFRSAGSDAPIVISGFACGTKAKPMSRPGLVCLVERLDLSSAGGDPALTRFFADAEFKRSAACAGSAMAPTPTHVNWIDQADARPQLRSKKAR